MNTTSVFVFGTLRDRDLLELVCEQSADSLKCKAASLPGFEPRYVQGKVFPVLVEVPSSNAGGEIIEFTDTLMARLIRYETKNFALNEVSVRLEGDESFTCHYFANVGFAHITDTLWTLEQWQQLHKDSWMKMLRSL